MNYTKDNWWIITLNETNYSSGDFVVELLRFLHSQINFSYIVIGNVDGYNVSQIASDLNYRCILYENLLPLIKEAIQFLWCDLFCYTENDNAPNINLWDIPYPDIITNTNISIRFVDFSDIEIFVCSEELCNIIIHRYHVKQVFNGLLTDYTYLE